MSSALCGMLHNMTLWAETWSVAAAGARDLCDLRPSSPAGAARADAVTSPGARRSSHLTRRRVLRRFTDARVRAQPCACRVRGASDLCLRFRVCAHPQPSASATRSSHDQAQRVRVRTHAYSPTRAATATLPCCLLTHPALTRRRRPLCVCADCLDSTVAPDDVVTSKAGVTPTARYYWYLEPGQRAATGGDSRRASQPPLCARARNCP